MRREVYSQRLTWDAAQEPYRKRGYAKALATRLFKRSISEYGSDGWGFADVAPDNVGSRGMCKSLNGRQSWNCSW